MYHYIFTYYVYILNKFKSCNKVYNNYGDIRIWMSVTFMWDLIVLICVPVIKSQFTFWRFCKKLGSAIISLATSQSTSVYPLIIATHSHTTMIGSGTMSNDLKRQDCTLYQCLFCWNISVTDHQHLRGWLLPAKSPTKVELLFLSKQHY